MALIIQAKSKKLTIAARKGNSQQIEKDFQAAVEEAYEQALTCSELIQSEDVIFKMKWEKLLNFQEHIILFFLYVLFPIITRLS